MAIVYKLDDKQEELTSKISYALTEHRHVLTQAETGSGKTVIFSAITKRYLDKNPTKSVVIFVDRDYLVSQTRNTLYNWYGLYSQKITADEKHISPANIYVVMVETFDRRTDLDKFMSLFKNVGLVIIDEAHMGNFKKVFVHYYDCLFVGFTATPISADKKDPLKNYYGTLICGPTPSELIEINRVNPRRGIVPALELVIDNIDRSILKVGRDGEFDENFMGTEFSKSRQLENTINNWIKHSYGRKTIIYNANVTHSKDVTQLFKEHNLNVRHIDAKSKNVDEVYRWFKNESDAILCNVAKATTGFDETSVETIVTNLSIKSITKFRQIRGRGGRPHEYADGTFKEFFLHLDMGDNVVGGKMGEWHETINWYVIFENPNMPRPGVAPIKNCPDCGAILSATARICTAYVDDFLTQSEMECGHIFEFNDKVQDEMPREMRVITGGIDVAKNIEYFANKNEYVAMFETYKQIAALSKKEYGDYLDAKFLKDIIDVAILKVGQWFRLKNKRKFRDFNQGVKNNMLKEIQDIGFMIPVEELEELDKLTNPSA